MLRTSEVPLRPDYGHIGGRDPTQTERPESVFDDERSCFADDIDAYVGLAHGVESRRNTIDGDTGILDGFDPYLGAGDGIGDRSHSCSPRFESDAVSNSTPVVYASASNSSAVRAAVPNAIFSPPGISEKTVGRGNHSYPTSSRT